MEVHIYCKNLWTRTYFLVKEVVEGCDKITIVYANDRKAVLNKPTYSYKVMEAM